MNTIIKILDDVKKLVTYCEQNQMSLEDCILCLQVLQLMQNHETANETTVLMKQSGQLFDQSSQVMSNLFNWVESQKSE